MPKRRRDHNSVTRSVHSPASRIRVPANVSSSAIAKGLAVVNSVSPSYFDTYGTRLLAGRVVHDHDTSHAPKVFIISELTARRRSEASIPLASALRRSRTNVRILENQTFELDGYRFFGATLWTDFGLFDDRLSAMLAAGAMQTGMNDYRKIRRADTGKLEPKHTAMLHADTRLALTQFLEGGDRARSVVITHHGPSIKSLSLGNETDLISAAYVSKLDELITQHGPALWIHGHIHETRDYRIGSTRIINNALGYPTPGGTEAVGFRNDLVIEL